MGPNAAKKPNGGVSVEAEDRPPHAQEYTLVDWLREQMSQDDFPENLGTQTDGGFTKVDSGF